MAVQAVSPNEINRDKIRQRLERGVRIDLLDAMLLFDIRKFGRPGALWPLADLKAWGKRGDPLEMETEIHAETWVHLHCVVADNVTFLAETPTGMRIYDLRFALQPSTSIDEAWQVDEVLPTFSPETLPETVTAVRENPAVTFRRIVSADRPLTIGDYNRELAAAGLAVAPDSQRVSGITIAVGGQINPVEFGAISLHKALLVARFFVERDAGRYAGVGSKRAVARSLRRWLSEFHPDLSAARKAPDVDELDALVEDFRRYKIDLRSGRNGAVLETPES